MIEETYSLFWGGIYSQWAEFPITFFGMDFNCNEQFMMYCKAMAFDDIERGREIMEESSPYEQKKLGRRVRNFNFDRWNCVCNEVVYTANYCKFTQNGECFDYLIQDAADVIVEASPHDKVWGIGLSEDDPRARIRSEWQGENRLGQMITDVRKYLYDPSSMQYLHNKRICDTMLLFKYHKIDI